MKSELHDLVSAFVFGALDAAEKLHFEEHLRECAECQREARLHEETAAEVAATAAADPPPALRDRLLRRLRKAPRFPGVLLQDAGLLISRSAEMAWQELAPGVETKLLYGDTGRQYNTLLVRMAADTYYPGHRHTDVEELFILSGDLVVEGEVMRTGDYCRAEQGTQHGQTYSQSGALFLLLASQNNELLASA